MAAEEMTETVYNVSPNLGGKTMKFKYTAVTNGDWIIFPDPIGAVFATDGTGAQMTTLYAAGATAAIAAADSTTLTDATFTANQRPASGYILINEEIVKYSGATKSSTSGTLTLDARGCFGTTAAIHGSSTCYVLNTVVFSTATGLIRGIADVIEE